MAFFGFQGRGNRGESPCGCAFPGFYCLYAKEISLVEDLGSGHEDRTLAVLHLVGVVPHAHLVAGHVGRVDGQHEVAAVGEHDERLAEGGGAEVAAQPYVHDRNSVVGQRPAAVHRIGVGRVGALCIEVLLVQKIIKIVAN